MSNVVGLITDSGVFVNPTSTVPFKQDKLGHKWIVVMTYALSRAEADGLTQGTYQMQFDTESLADVSPVACLVCELVYEIAEKHECPGEPKGYEDSGRPIHHQRWVREAFREADEKRKKT